MAEKKTMTVDELRRAARAVGIPAHKIDDYLRDRHGIPSTADVVAAHAEAPVLPYVIRLVIPWSALISDNRKWAPAKRGERAVMILTDPYRDAKERIEALAREAMTPGAHQCGPRTGPLAYVARVYVPDNRRHDTVNFAKIVQDSLSEIVFQDDSQLHDARWIRAGVDVDRPRAEIEIQPLSQ